MKSVFDKVDRSKPLKAKKPAATLDIQKNTIQKPFHTEAFSSTNAPHDVSAIDKLKTEKKIELSHL